MIGPASPPFVARRGGCSLLSVVLALGSALSGAQVVHSDGFEQSADPEFELNPVLLSLPANRWIELHQPATADWRRQAHAGVAYDTKRGTVLMFGSDTHETDRSNEVFEFDPVALEWQRHYAEAPVESYRADAEGRAIAGEIELLPWAMHVFDTLVYDPVLDALIVGSTPAHNGELGRLPEVTTINITWVYDLATRQWRMLENNGQAPPSFFPGSAAYDSKRDTAVAYLRGIWELGPAREVWRQASAVRHHGYHHMMVYDSGHDKLLVFGDNDLSNSVWVYQAGTEPGSPGTWSERRPLGDAVPPDQHFPIAYDASAGLVVLLVDDLVSASSDTYIYDYGTNRYQRLPQASFPFQQNMNYMMVYDQRHRVCLLITGNFRQPATVWALRLAPGELP